MSANTEVLTDGLKDFIEEMTPLLSEAEGTIVSWGAGEGGADTVNSLFRTFHNIKGTSGMFGLSQLQEVFHNAESLLGAYRDKGLKANDEVSELLLQALDQFKAITAFALENAAEPGEKPYLLLHRMVEARRNALASSESNEGNEGQKETKKGAADESIRISAQNAGELVEIVSDYIQLQNRMEMALGPDGAATAVKNDMKRFSTRLQNFVLSIRLAPIQPLLTGLQRTASAAARDVGKKFRMQINGGDTQLDRRVIELLRDPLIHMIRNSIDHGLENPEERTETKKPPEGLIVFEAFQQSGQVVLALSDDGRGIDAERVKKKAVEKGILAKADAERMGHRDAMRLIFLPGFSTAEKVTSLSGRGVGMDAVKTAVEAIGGIVDIESELGRGTKITLTLPLTLAIVKSLAFKVASQLYAVPQTAVEEVITEAAVRGRGDLSHIEGKGKVLHLRKAVVPVISLPQLFNAGPETRGRSAVFIVVKHRNLRFALEADSILGPRDFVSQPLPPVHAGVDVINGVNQLNSGEYIGLLDMGTLERMLESTSMGHATSDPNYTATEGQPNTSDIFRSQQKLVFFKSGKLLAIPVQSIRQVVTVPSASIDTVGERDFLTFEAKTYPILRLSHHYGGQKLKPQPHYTAMLVQREGNSAAIICEEFHGIHRLPREFELLVTAPGIQGSVNHDGKTYLVGNVNSIFALEFPEAFSMQRRASNKFHILIAEDDPFFAAYLSDFLKNNGFQTSIAKNGREAKDFLESSVKADGGTPAVDYLITDLEMPEMSGLDLLGWVRSHAQLAALPTILCTAVGDDTARRAAAKLGVDFYSGKMKYEDMLPHIIGRQKGSEIGLSGEAALPGAPGSGLGGDSPEAASEGGAATAETNRRVLAFAIGSRTFAVEISHLKEISSASNPTRIPGLPGAAANIVGFRGHPIPVLDLRQLAGTKFLPGRAEQIVAKFGDHLCALWVDRVFNVRRAQVMHRATGLNKSDARSDDRSGIGSLIGDVLWDDNEALAVIDSGKVSKLLDFIKTKVEKASQAKAA